MLDYLKEPGTRILSTHAFMMRGKLMSLSSQAFTSPTVLIDVVNNECVISILPLNFYRDRKPISVLIVGEHFYYEEILIN